MRAQAILFSGVDQVELDATEIPEPGEGQVLIAVANSCISPGTELRCLAGKQPDASPWPFIPGYALAGRVAARGRGVALPLGAPVFSGGTQAASHARMWGGHVSHALLDEAAVFPLPPGLALLDASAARLAAIALHGIRLCRPQIDDTVAVVGLGPIGQLSARLAALSGARVVATDRVTARVELARAAGVEAYLAGGSLAETLAPAIPGGADVVIDATGAAAVLPQAVELARTLPWDDLPTPGARYVVQGSYPDALAIPYHAAFHKELSFLVPRDTQPRDIRRALELLASGALRVADLLGAPRPPDAAPQTYAALRAGEAGMMTAVFGWENA
ncbi:MAG: alcohol dehydrogenase catalytic domain-containing protein [Roseiflexaceae bacterium]